jgi:hypothetical protein
VVLHSRHSGCFVDLHFVPEIKEDLIEVLLELERMRREVRAQSDDGTIVNLLWEKFMEGLYSQRNGNYFVLSERVKDPTTKELKEIPLQTSEVKDLLGWTSRKVRFVIHSLQLVDGTDPPKLLRLDRVYRPIYFTPKRLITRAEDFDPDFPESVKNVPKEFVTDVTDVTDYITGSGKDKPEPEPEVKSVTSVTSVTNPGADGLPREPDKAQYPPVAEQMRPQHCPHPELCGYYGVFLYPNDLEEHLQKLHGGVSQ